MSSASFSSSRSTATQTQRGFSTQDVNTFLRRGGQLASQRITDIEALRPAERARTTATTTTTTQAGSLARLFGAERGGTTTTTAVTGFRGEFAQGITTEKLDELTNSFLQRQRQISQRRAQPGRSALFSARS